MNSEFKLRRDRLSKYIGNNSAAILFSAEENRFGEGAYHQNSDFYYLTGFIEPESIAVLIPQHDDGEFILFSRKRDFAKELWCGSYVGQEGACKDFYADQAFPIDEMENVLPDLLTGREIFYTNIQLDSLRYQKIKHWLVQHKLVDLGEVLHPMRLKKSQHELDIIRRAVDITVQGHIRAIERCRSGIYEFELEAELLYEFIRLGARYPSFEPIVASGTNACTLHYSKNSKKMIAEELVLVDAGIKYNYYCTDITRTFPVEGVFTAEQRAIYEIVLEAHRRVIKEIKPGVSWSHLQHVAEYTITEGLVSIGLLKGDVDSLLEQGGFKPFFMHKVGHFIGLDVHDVRMGDSCLLEQNMVFTVEPGVYISPNIPDIDSRWQGIGVRIEDNILVTNSGCEVLTRKIPVDVAEIENVRK